MNSEAVLNLLKPYLMQPGLLLGVFLFICVLVPLMEELFKPIGVWLLAGRMPTPPEGFIAGALSGAGYALFENIFIASPGPEWAAVSLGRVGTTTMHVLTTGITGYALASAWSHRKYGRLGVLFLVAVLLHSLWNGLTLLNLASNLPASWIMIPGISRLGQAAAIDMGGYSIALFAGLMGLNRSLRKYAIIPTLTQATGQTETPEQSANHEAAASKTAPS